MIDVIPAILEKDFPAIEAKLRKIEHLVSWVQIDIANNTLVPNMTFLDPEPFAALKLPFSYELHMMVEKPALFVERFANVGFKRFFAHIEADGVEEFMATCYKLDVEVGLAIDGPTPFEKIHPYLDNLDAVLVMAIDAGFSGRPFRDDTIEKIKKIREVDFEIPIAVDGAMNDVNAAKVVAAGATRINSNSYIFGSSDISAAIEKLRKLDTIRQ